MLAAMFALLGFVLLKSDPFMAASDAKQAISLAGICFVLGLGTSKVKPFSQMFGASGNKSNE
ncbi:MAG: hypothetical protein AAFN12_14085 [Cyanobacteria bacterium J06560_2]